MIPDPKQVPHPLVTHGHVREDPYYWMRSDDRSDPEVVAHLRAENAYTQAMLAPLTPLREALYREIVARIPADDASVPYALDGFLFYARVEKGREYPIHCRKCASLEADEEVLVDANTEAAGHAYYHATSLRVSVDGNTLAFAEDTLSRRIYTIRFRDLRTGEDLPDRVQGTAGNHAWALDGRTLFYVKREPGTLRAHQVWRHTLGTGADRDVLVHDERDPEFGVFVLLSRSREYALIGCHQTQSHEYLYVPADAPATRPRVVLPREPGHEYVVDHAHGRFWIRTNADALDFRLMSALPEESGDRSRWREEIPARPGVFLRGFELFEDFLVLSERREGLARLRVIPWGDREAGHEIAFDEPVYTTALGVNAEFVSGVLRLEYTSLTTPASVIDYDMARRSRTLRKRERVEGEFDPADYVTERRSALARDGTEVWISLVRRRDLDTGTPQPLLLYGYGSYGLSIDPAFASARLSLLERGVIFAIAHVRGGQEKGRAWYEDGKLLRKRNTFGDFVDCARSLVSEGVTAPDRLFAEGGSAGGLLMGAVMNEAPELWRAVVAHVPFVDVLTTMLDPTIPLTTSEYDEWGNPNDREAYDYILGYSPYDNVGALAYPSVLVLTGLHDSQVQYWEPAKWVARLRERSTSESPILLHTDLDAGHGGASGRFRRHRDTALVYAFLLDQLQVRS